MTTCIDDIEFTLSYSYTPARQGVHTTKGGDPGWPDEPEQIEDIILTAIFKDCELAGQLFIAQYDDLPKSVQYRIYNEICDFEENKRADGISAAYERED